MFEPEAVAAQAANAGDARGRRSRPQVHPTPSRVRHPRFSEQRGVGSSNLFEPEAVAAQAAKCCETYRGLAAAARRSIRTPLRERQRYGGSGVRTCSSRSAAFAVAEVPVRTPETPRFCRAQPPAGPSHSPPSAAPSLHRPRGRRSPNWLKAHALEMRACVEHLRGFESLRRPLRESANKRAWLSPVERCVRVAEVPGSNPGAPILPDQSGRMAEWLKAHDWKSCGHLPAWVRIPLRPLSVSQLTGWGSNLFEPEAVAAQAANAGDCRGRRQPPAGSSHPVRERQ